MNSAKDITTTLTVDSFSFLWNEMADQFEYLNTYRNVLAVVGAAYVTGTAIRILYNLIHGFASHGISRFFPVRLAKTGKWAVVTGPTEGIGKAFAIELAKQGMPVVLLGRNVNKLQEVSDFIRTQYNKETKIVIIDFSDPGKAYEKVDEVFYNTDIGLVVNNAGTIHKHPAFLYEISDNEIETMLKVNIEAVTKITQLAVIHMRKKKMGYIINVSSIASLAPAPLLQVYAATKAYVTSFSRAVQAEVERDGITVQTLLPSYVNTRMVGYSRRLTTSWFVPSPETYVQNAIRTLKYSSYTTGYWFHGIQAFMISQFPVTWYVNFIRKTNVVFRNEYLSQRDD